MDGIKLPLEELAIAESDLLLSTNKAQKQSKHRVV
jgi:hypothetical protein